MKTNDINTMNNKKMIIDNIKKYILSILGKVHKSQNDNVIQTKSEIEDKTHEVTEKRNNIPVFYDVDVSINLIDDDLVDERIPCVYGPPSWYKENGRLDRENPDVKEFMHEAHEIERRNQRSKELRNRLQYFIDEPIPDVNGPDPRIN